MSAATPAHPFAGSDGIGNAHCLNCHRVGHVVAHPSLGCADVGCDREHGEAVRLTRRPDVERAAIYVGRLEDDVRALADVDLSAVALAPHADALEQAWMTIAAVRAAVTP